MSPDRVFDVTHGGLGDCVCAAWIAEGAREHGVEIHFTRETRDPNGTIWNREAEFTLLGQTLTDAPGVKFHPNIFSWELTVRGVARTPRPLFWQYPLSLDVPPRRPRVRVPEADARWAAELLALRPGGPVAVVFPFASYQSRCWPVVKWARLAHALEADGWRVWTVCQPEREPDLEGFPPFRVSGESLSRCAALCGAATAVLANDSGPAHLAGTMGTKTFALMGPTDPRCVFGYAPDIEAITAPVSVAPCVGCHFEPERGYGRPCHAMCDALASLSWPAVLEAVRTWRALKEPHELPVCAPAGLPAGDDRDVQPGQRQDDLGAGVR